MKLAVTMRSIALACAMAAAPATAAQDFELWFNPAIATDIDKNTGLEFETAQRLRKASDAADTYFFRLWLNQQINKNVTLSAAIERRIQDGGRDETRVHQQASLKHGILRGRIRLTQRLINDTDRTGIRLQLRGGVKVPLDTEKKWAGIADVETFHTLRATSATGQKGLTGVRTQLGVSREVNDHLTLSLTYVRNEDITRNRDNRVGHAPLIGIDLSF